ncbi:MAG: MmcB family DNA repair protein [Pseudomonadota bacterium]
MPDDHASAPLTPGQSLARGVCRALAGEHDFACAEEVTLAGGLRVDVMAVGRKGEIWVVECKSSRTDYTSDGKWDGYLEWADRFFWAVGPDFPTDLLPPDTGLILADSYGAEIVRTGPETKLAGARRKAVMLRFARHCARRAQAARDPDGLLPWGI